MKNPLGSKFVQAAWSRIKRAWAAVVVTAKIVAGLAAIRTAAKFIWDALHTVGVL